MARTLCVILTLLCTSLAHAQVNEVRLKWDAVPGVTGYKVYYGTSTRDYNTIIDTGILTQTVLNMPTENTRWYIALKSVNIVGESVNFSREVQALARAEIVNVPSSCVAITGAMRCTASIAGFNFDTAAVASITYPGVTVVSSTWLDSRSIELVFDIALDSQGGQADLVVSQPWTVTAGTAIPGDDNSTGGDVITVEADVITITPVVLPNAVGNVEML